MANASGEMTLNQLKNGERGRVTRVELSGTTKRRLIEMGITPGVGIMVRKRAPLAIP